MDRLSTCYIAILVVFMVLLGFQSAGAQPFELPAGACITPEVMECQNPDAAILKWSEGTDAWPDQSCNPDETFGGCDTNSCNFANAWAQSVCASNGYEVGIWTGNKQAGCGPGGPGGPVENGTGDISMFCFAGGESLIPCNPEIETECDPGDQTQVEVLCCNVGEAPPPPPTTVIPTLSEWGLVAMAGILGIVGFMVIRRRKAVV